MQQGEPMNAARRRSRGLGAVGAIGVLATVIAACTPTPATDPVQLMYAEREGSVMRVAPERTLEDLLPNRSFSIDGEPARPLAAGVVVGTVDAIEPGAAYAAGQDSPGGTRIPFDDPDALWRLMIASLDVERSVGSVPEAGVVRVVLPIDGDVDPAAFSRDVEAMGTVIAVLDRPGAFAADPSAHPVRWDGVFLAPVDSAGGFTFAALGDAAEEFQAGLDTVDEVMAAAHVAEVVVESTAG